MKFWNDFDFYFLVLTNIELNQTWIGGEINLVDFFCWLYLCGDGSLSLETISFDITAIAF